MGRYSVFSTSDQFYFAYYPLFWTFTTEDQKSGGALAPLAPLLPTPLKCSCFIGFFSQITCPIISSSTKLAAIKTTWLYESSDLFSDYMTNDTTIALYELHYVFSNLRIV